MFKKTSFEKKLIKPLIKPMQKLLMVSSITLAVVSSPVFAESSEVVNARQEAQIWTTYALSPYLRAHDIKVSVSDGKATLSGVVEEDVNKDLAKQIALGVSGIKEVDNQIQVQADYVVPMKPKNDRGYGDVIDDATITSAVKSKLLWSKYADGLTTDVDTQSGKVRLTGTADSTATKNIAGRLAMNTHGVVAVDNRLVVDKTTIKDKAILQSAGTDIADSWITTKVKSTFMYSRNVNANDIKVSTHGGVVSLSGKVDSGAERALAIELAGNIRGVKSVQSTALTL